jgi:hypothetical protein
MVLFMRVAIGLLIATCSTLGGTASPKLPIMFERNVGQSDPAVRFICRRPSGATLLLRDSGAVFQGRGFNIAMTLIGADPHAHPNALGMLPGHVNYLFGTAPEPLANIPVFSHVEYRYVYPGISLLFYSNGNDLEYDFAVDSEADVSAIRLRFTGMSRFSIDDQGALLFETPTGKLHHAPPNVYQIRKGRKVVLPSRYRILEGGDIGFEVGTHDRSSPLVVDPAITFSTYLGGHGGDAGVAVTTDAFRNVYLTGWTELPDMPAAVTLGSPHGIDIFVAKLNASDLSLAYLTYIGGESDDRPAGIAVDSAGSAILAGTTHSRTFPTYAAARSTLSGTQDAFVLKLSPTGASLLFSTFWGGTGANTASGVALDTTGSIYVVGTTDSTAFPTRNPLQAANAGKQDAFLTKFDSTGAPQYSTYLGGAGDDFGMAVAVDAGGNPFVAGGTYSVNFPVLHPLQSTNAGGEDAFLVKIAASGGGLIYGTYIGGDHGDSAAPETATGVAVDRSGSAYVTGVTSSPNFPTSSGVQTIYGGGATDAFICRVNTGGTKLLYSTYVGGSSTDYATAITLNGAGTTYITGYTVSPDFPIVSATQTTRGGDYDAFVTGILPNGAALTFSTYLGGSAADAANGIAVDVLGRMYVVGQTLSGDLPLRGALQTYRSGIMDSFVTAFDIGIRSGSAVNYSVAFPLPNGPNNFYLAYILFLPTPNIVWYTAKGSCLIEYNRISNGMRLINDPGTDWLGPISGVPLTQGGSLTNSQCTVNIAQSSVQISPTALMFNVTVAFNPNLKGFLGVFMQSLDVTGVWTGMNQIADWTAFPITTPAAGPYIQPASQVWGVGSSATLTVTAGHTSGVSALSMFHVLISDAIVGGTPCQIVYFPATGKLNLINDTGTALVSPSGISPGSGVLSNSRCSVNGAGFSANSSGQTVSLTLPMSFSTSAFAGTKNIYVNAFDNWGSLTHWVQAGTWVVR